MKVEQFSRLLHHRTTVSGQQFTIPTSNDHTDETWLSTDLYIGEIGINVTDNTAFFRSNNGIIPLAVGTSSGASASAALWNWSSPNIIIGTTYSADSVSPRSGYYTDLGTSTLRWKNLFLGGGASTIPTINVNGGLLLTEASSNGILSSGWESADNTPIQIFSTSSNINKGRVIHINSKNAYSLAGNQKVTIGSTNITDNASSDSIVMGQRVTINTGVTSSVHIGEGYSKTNYNSQMVTVGNLAVRGIPDDGSNQYAKSDWITKQAQLRTANALTTNLVTLDTWADDGTTIQVKAYIMGVSIQDASLVYSAELFGTYYGGASYTAGPVGTPILNAQSSWVGDQPDCEMACDINGVYIKVTGRGSDTIQWICTYSTQKFVNMVP